MKVPPRQLESFIKAPDPAARVILIYGPDDGLMRARSKALAGGVVSDLNDPFNVAVLHGPEITTDPARLRDEAHAQSLMGGARVIRVEQAADGLSPAVKAYLEDPATENLVILEAGELPPRSALRKLIESAKNAAAIPCYVEDMRSLPGTIRNILSEDGFSASPDAVTWLAANLAGDRGRVTSELHKLKIYMGEEKRIELSDAQAACGTGGAQSMDDFVFALAGKQPGVMMGALHQLSQEGLPTIALLRALQNHFRRLHITATRIQAGQSRETAMKSLSPPVFFKYEDAFKAQLQRWSQPALAAALQKLTELEARCKQTGTPEMIVSAQAFLSLAAGR